MIKCKPIKCVSQSNRPDVKETSSSSLHLYGVCHSHVQGVVESCWDLLKDQLNLMKRRERAMQKHFGMLVNDMLAASRSFHLFIIICTLFFGRVLSMS